MCFCLAPWVQIKGEKQQQQQQQQLALPIYHLLNFPLRSNSDGDFARSIREMLMKVICIFWQSLT